MTHTPGPWRQIEWNKVPAIIHDRADGKRDIIVTFPFSSANARLIAAAPELLAALQEIAELGDVRANEAGQIARAAIAKATGE